jgi:hypothetical protein
MHTHRFGRKLKLPSTIALKHQIRKLMFEDSVKKAEAGARAEAIRGQLREWLSLARQDEAMDDLFANWDMSETA